MTEERMTTTTTKKEQQLARNPIYVKIRNNLLPKG